MANVARSYADTVRSAKELDTGDCKPLNREPYRFKADMDSFTMRHGLVTYIGKKVMFLDFLSPHEEKSVAVAVNNVCYFGDCLSGNLDRDFRIGDKVMFSAVKCSDLWKAVCVWTTYKPSSSFKIQEWESDVSKFYTSTQFFSEMNLFMEHGIVKTLYWKIKNDLGQQLFHHRRENLSALLDSENDIKYIEKTYGSVLNYIKNFCPLFKISRNGNIFPARQSKNCLENYLQIILPMRILGEDGEIRTCEVEDEDQEQGDEEDISCEQDTDENQTVAGKKKLNERAQERMANEDKIQEKGCINYTEDRRVVEDWFHCESEEKIQEKGCFNDREDRRVMEDWFECKPEDSNQEDIKNNYKCEDGRRESNVVQQSYVNRTWNWDNSLADITSRNKVFLLEKEAVTYFSSVIQKLYEIHGYVFSPSSKAMEHLLNDSPDHIRIYVKEKYNDLRQFLNFHNSAFSVGHSYVVIAPTEKNLEEYLSHRLKCLIPHDASSKDLYDTFVSQNRLIGINPFRSEESDIRVFQGSPQSEEIYYSDDEESGFLESPTPDNLSSKEVQVPHISSTSTMEDASTQTVSTGQVLSTQHYLE